jgi:hypothetical protein
MLTEKCPYCGSYNDVTAGECYYCHKDLPDQPGKPKKKRNKKPASTTIIFTAPATAIKRKSPPGCLVVFAGAIILLALFVVFQWVNGTYQFIHWQIPVLPTETGAYIAYYLAGLVNNINLAIQYPIPLAVTIVMFLILCYGMLGLKKWARTLALILLLMILVGNFALFVNIVIHYATLTASVPSFLLILFVIIVNSYALVWFFEHKKLFE